jgi:hypothetical protein
VEWYTRAVCMDAMGVKVSVVGDHISAAYTAVD